MQTQRSIFLSFSALAIYEFSTSHKARAGKQLAAIAFSLSHAMPMCVLVCVLHPHVCSSCPVYTYIRKYCASFFIFLSSCTGDVACARVPLLEWLLLAYETVSTLTLTDTLCC